MFFQASVKSLQKTKMPDRCTCAEHNLQSHGCQFLPKLIVTFRQRSFGGFSLFVRSILKCRY